LNRFGLVKDDCLTNAGNVLFGNTHPVTLKAAIFATDEKLTFLDMQLYEDNIYNLLSQSEKYILSNIRWRNEIIGSGREELPEIPVVVIREILANSFAHAVYNSNTYHEICIYPNKITIYSPGAYASSYKPEDYISRNLPSSIRNATISKILYLNKSIEQFGSGFKRINSLCRDAKIKYSYETSYGGFSFIIYRNIISDVETNRNNEENSHDAVTLNATERAIYDLLSNNPYYTRNELSEAISKTVKTVQRNLDSLKNKGLIERVGGDKKGYWNVL
jgi:ATP-dependent DNA helicase RecG